MAAYYPLFDDEMKEGPIGPSGIGFKLTDDGNYDMEKKKLKNVDEPVDISDASTKSYVDLNKMELKSDIVKLQKRSLIHSEYGDFDAKNKIIGNVKDPVNGKNVVNKQYLENNALTLRQTNTVPPEDFYDLKSIPLKNLSNPRDKNDAVPKQYVDKKTKINDKKPDNQLMRNMDGFYVEYKSCNIKDTAQVIFFVSYMLSQGPKEELLGLLPPSGQTRREDIENAVQKCLEDNGIDINKIVSIAIDGARNENASAMPQANNSSQHSGLSPVEVLKSPAFFKILLLQYSIGKNIYRKNLGKIDVKKNPESIIRATQHYIHPDAEDNLDDQQHRGLKQIFITAQRLARIAK
ncbi:unnamed protein product [Larinioides sclopetarius]|uniref:Uncharacterized protein n=1 Tax=Larinioides sclopetarius TaxID=280406 RepID=A0AAV2BYJ0_9ARAC